MRRASLLVDVTRLLDAKTKAFAGLGETYRFVVSAAAEAAHGHGVALFSRLRSAGQRLPSALDELVPPVGLKSPDGRVPLFLRAQLFIALMAELEDMLAELARSVLLAFPEKLQKATLDAKVIALETSVGSLRDRLVTNELTGLFYAKPADYRARWEEILSAPKSMLDPFWDAYVEAKATRDIGLHNGWKVNRLYVEKAGSKARPPDVNERLFPDEAYFSSALTLADSMASVLRSHCDLKFANCTNGSVFQKMWNDSSLAPVVAFDKAWRVTPDGVQRVPGFSWRWSSTELLLWEFFERIYSGQGQVDVVSIRQRWGSRDVALVNEWLEAPFFL